MTRETFDLELGRLAILPGMPGDSDAYWEALQDIPAPVITSAIGYALKTRKWFPVPVELRQDADTVRPRQAYQPPVPKAAKTRIETIRNPFGGKDITVEVSEAFDPNCTACSDTGWESVWCGPCAPQMKPWHTFVTCSRHGAHPSHEWVRKCHCWDTNAVLIRKRESQASYAVQREQKR